MGTNAQFLGPLFTKCEAGPRREALQAKQARYTCHSSRNIVGNGRREYLGECGGTIFGVLTGRPPNAVGKGTSASRRFERRSVAQYSRIYGGYVLGVPHYGTWEFGEPLSC